MKQSFNKNRGHLWSEMSAAGNSFLVRHVSRPLARVAYNQLSLKKLPAQARRLCNRYGRDGLMILIPGLKTDYWEWVFYNRDGTSAEMCGNVACCGVEYLFKKKLVKTQKIYLKTPAGFIEGTFLNRKPQIFLPISSAIRGPYFVSYAKKKVSYFFSDHPVSHAVVKWPLQNLVKKPLLKKLKEKNLLHLKQVLPPELLPLAKKLRHSLVHNKNGMNVSFYFEKSYGKLWGFTFERGVEDITSACGTGAMALAQVYQKQVASLCTPVRVQMPGGDLVVRLDSKQISLQSPVCWIQR